MWIFSKYGFFSIVSARKNNGNSNEIDLNLIMLRSRSKNHIENLQNRFDELKNLEILETTNSDYRFRTFVPKNIWCEISKIMAQELDYDNFKNKVSRENKDYEYLDCLHDVWNIMYDYQNAQK